MNDFGEGFIGNLIVAGGVAGDELEGDAEFLQDVGDGFRSAARAENERPPQPPQGGERRFVPGFLKSEQWYAAFPPSAS